MMNTHQMLERLNNSRHEQGLRLKQCILDAVGRGDWAAVIALAKIARKVQGGAS
jgi:hypothetical protein